MVSIANNSPSQTPLPRQLVAPLLTRGIVHLPVAGCQYRGVYRHKGNKWRATVKLTWRGGGEVKRVMHHVAGRCLTPLEAATKLAAWFELWLGPRWGEIVSRHRRHLWKHAPWQARYSEKRKGWVLAVWVDGLRREVMTRDKLVVFRSWWQAREAVHPWLATNFGERAHLRMWR